MCNQVNPFLKRQVLVLGIDFELSQVVRVRILCDALRVVIDC